MVFDVDGTLYEQAPLRRKMAVELLTHCMLRPWRLGLLRRLQTFRKERERLSEDEVAGARRAQFAVPAEVLNVPEETLEREVEEWIHDRPLQHLAGCRVPGVRGFFERLRTRGVRIAVLSDYPAAAKLEALGLEAEIVVSGVDPEVDRLKPHPAGLLRVLELLDLPPEQCLMVGDRDDRDGECARRSDVDSLLRGTADGAFAQYRELL